MLSTHLDKVQIKFEINMIVYELKQNVNQVWHRDSIWSSILDNNKIKKTINLNLCHVFVELKNKNKLKS